MLAAPSAPARPVATVPPLIRVLIVEDREDDYHYVRMLLVRNPRQRYEVDWASDYETGFEKLRARRHDVALFDYRLGEKNGLDLLKEQQAAGDYAPVILLTGSDDPQVDMAAVAAGAADYLNKGSLDTTRLDRAIRYAVSHAAVTRALRESQRQLELFLRNVPCAVAIQNGRGELVFANDLFERSFGASALDALRASADADGCVLQPVQVSANERHWLASVFPMEDGEAPGLVGIAAIDITGRVLAERLSRHKSQLLSGITAKLPVAVGRIDADGCLAEIEGSGLRRFGLSPEELVGTDVGERIPQAMDYIRRALAGETLQFPLNGRAGGEPWYLDVHLFFDAEHGSGAIFFVRDVTSRRLLEEKVLRISEDERRRIGGDLHDSLGQQLTGIACLTTVLRDKLRGKDEELTGEAETIASLVQEAIAQTRGLARGLCPVQMELHGLQSALEDLVYNIQRLHRVDCELEVKGSTADLEYALCIQLYRIVQEGISNAIRHGDANRISVSLDLSGPTATLVIRDDGRGFVPSENPAPSVGLHLMQHRAGLIGGNVRITSQPGEGTRVECSFSNPLPHHEDHDDEKTGRKAGRKKAARTAAAGTGLHLDPGERQTANPVGR